MKDRSVYPVKNPVDKKGSSQMTKGGKTVVFAPRGHWTDGGGRFLFVFRLVMGNFKRPRVGYPAPFWVLHLLATAESKFV